MAEDEVEVVPVLKESFNFLRKDPEIIGLFLLTFITVMFHLVYTWLAYGNLMATPFQMGPGTQGLQLSFVIEFIIYMAIAMIIGLFVYSAIILKVSARKEGERPGFLDSLIQSSPHIPSLFVAYLIFMALTFGPYFFFTGAISWFVISTGVYSTPPIVIWLLIGMLIWIIPMIYFAIRLSFFGPACVLEDLGPIDTLKKTWHVTKGNFWLLFAFFLILILISVAIIIPASHLGKIAGLAASFGTMLIIGPTATVALTLLYSKLKKTKQ